MSSGEAGQVDRCVGHRDAILEAEDMTWRKISAICEFHVRGKVTQILHFPSKELKSLLRKLSGEEAGLVGRRKALRKRRGGPRPRQVPPRDPPLWALSGVNLWGKPLPFYI